MKRNELVRKTIGPALQFFSGINRGDKVAIICGHDLDSVCSASICHMLAKEFGADVNVVVSQLNFSVAANTLEKLEPKFVIFVDLAEIPQEIFDRFHQYGKVLVIDHHPVKNYREISYSNPRIYKKDIYMPTTYIAYKIFSHFSKSNKALWIACLGTLADHGARENKDIFAELKKRNPNLVERKTIEDDLLFRQSTLGRLVGIVGSGEVVARRSGAMIALNALLRAKNPDEILQGKFKEAKALNNTYKIVLEEYERVLDDFLERKKLYGKIIFYEIDSHLNLKSTLAGSVAKLFKGKIIAISQRADDSYDVSFRRGAGVKDDLGQFAKKAISGIPNSSGGGHEAAAAARIPKDYLKKFLENLA